MDIVPPLSHTTTPIKKEDLFYTILRLWQLAQDAGYTDRDDDGGSVEDTRNTDTADATEVVKEANTSPPHYFQKFNKAGSAFADELVGEYIFLFNLLCESLDVEPALQSEFVAYAEERGEYMEFTDESEPPPPSGPKLFIVPPPNDDLDDDAEPPA